MLLGLCWCLIVFVRLFDFSSVHSLLFLWGLPWVVLVGVLILILFYEVVGGVSVCRVGGFDSMWSGQIIYSSCSVLWWLTLYSYVQFGGFWLCSSLVSSREVNELVRGRRRYLLVSDTMGIFRFKRIDMRKDIYWPWVVLVGSIKDPQFILASSFGYFQIYALIASLSVLQPSKGGEYRQIRDNRVSIVLLQKAFIVNQEYSAVLTGQPKVHSRIRMENRGVGELVVHLEHSMDLSAMERGVKLVGMALANRSLNRWELGTFLAQLGKILAKLKLSG